MYQKKKGTLAERELVSAFWEKGWAAIRVAGSGSMHFPSPDVLAGNKSRYLAIECKVTKNKNKYFEKKEIENLLFFSSHFGAEAWVSVKFLRNTVYFISLDDLKKTEKSFVISLEKAKMVGLSFNQLVGEF